MLEEKRTAALFALVSVVFFTVSSHLTKLLVEHTSVILIMSLRTLVAAGVLWVAFVFMERRFSLLILACRSFWWWLATFMATILLYGLAFASRSVDDVLIIAATMPLIVMLVDFLIDRQSLKRSVLPIVVVMFLAAAAPSGYQLIYGEAKLVLSFGTAFAVGATICHAAWIILGRLVQKYGPDETKAAGRLAIMFTIAGIVLFILTEFQIPQWFEERTRRSSFLPGFWRWAEFWDFWKLGGAGILAGLSALFIVLAIKRDTPGRVIPYQYTVAIWTLVLTLSLGTSPYSFGALIVAIVSAGIIGGGAVLLYLKANV